MLVGVTEERGLGVTMIVAVATIVVAELPLISSAAVPSETVWMLVYAVVFPTPSCPEELSPQQ